MNCSTKPKGVTTQMKVIDEYFLMVVFVLLLNRVHVFEKHGSERVKELKYFLSIGVYG